MKETQTTPSLLEEIVLAETIGDKWSLRHPYVIQSTLKDGSKEASIIFQK